MKYDIALIEKYGIDGLNKTDIDMLYGLVTDSAEDGNREVFPIELEAREHESSAMGFISSTAADMLDYDYEISGLHNFIATILDDMNNENENHEYVYKGINIYLSR